MERFNKLCNHFYNVAKVVVESEVATKALHETLHQFNSNLPTKDDTTDKGRGSFNFDSDPNNGTKICSLLCLDRKGRPSSKRTISVSETVGKEEINQPSEVMIERLLRHVFFL
ncbi:hypothetical protein P8452_43887 [Trifolium repens]|nr:hypothetical protein QL285_028834 [Trifolium repens]WJX58432.1 hypothetical protein P8452_43887 [Trifolium repens]